MDKKEYNRNYYYKRDKVKLDKYRKKYQRKIKNREYLRKRRLEQGIKPRVKLVDKDITQMTTKQRWWYNNPDKTKEYRKKFYENNKERVLEDMNFKYRAKKLEEFVDNVINLPDDNKVDNYGRR